jgi:hypothetical protein
MARQHLIPEWAHLHHEAERCYSEKAAAYLRWDSRCRVTGYAPQSAGRSARAGARHRPARPASVGDAG